MKDIHHGIRKNFLGKLIYELDSKETYEVFREFKKKNPKIYNSNKEDISKNFNIDKNNGNQFFYEQTKVDEELFLSTIVSEQEEVRLDEKAQNTLVQKMTNLAGTGDDNTSFNKIIAKLNKRQLEEIGTLRSQDRPINIVTKKLEEIKKEQEELKQYSYKKYDIEEEKKQYKNMILEQTNTLKLVKELKKIKEKENIEKQKLELNQKLQQDYNKQIEELEEQISSIENKCNNNTNVKNTKKSKIHIILLSILVISTIAFIFINKIVSIIIAIITSIYFIIYSYKQYKSKILKTNNTRQQNVEIAKLKNELSIIENTKEKQTKELQNMQKQIEIETNQNLQQLKNSSTVKIEEIEELYKKDLENFIDELSLEINKNQVREHMLEVDKQNIIPKLEDLTKLEEQKQNLQQEKAMLEFNNNSINLAKEELQKAYNIMKQNVTPKFTQELSKIISKISKGKYQNVKFDEENGIVVEIENGDYTLAKNLSVGTIDQLYLALRLSTTSEISEENMPIILDEAFAYYDNERLQNIMEFLNSEYKNRQIIIFTCTNREKDVLEKMNLEYNLINL